MKKQFLKFLSVVVLMGGMQTTISCSSDDNDGSKDSTEMSGKDSEALLPDDFDGYFPNYGKYITGTASNFMAKYGYADVTGEEYGDYCSYSAYPLNDNEVVLDWNTRTGKDVICVVTTLVRESVVSEEKLCQMLDKAYNYNKEIGVWYNGDSYEKSTIHVDYYADDLKTGSYNRVRFYNVEAYKDVDASAKDNNTVLDMSDYIGDLMPNYGKYMAGSAVKFLRHYNLQSIPRYMSDDWVNIIELFWNKNNTKDIELTYYKSVDAVAEFHAGIPEGITQEQVRAALDSTYKYDADEDVWYYGPSYEESTIYVSLYVSKRNGNMTLEIYNKPVYDEF